LSSGLLADYQGTLPGGDLSPVHDLMDRLAITSNQFANDPLNQSPYENRSEWSRQLSLKAQGKALQELLPQIVKNDPMGARLLAERYADALPNKAQTMSAIEHSEVSKRAEDAASEALVIGAAKSGGFNALGLPNGSLAEQETEALNHIRGLDVPQNIKDAALNRVQARFDENRRIEKQWNEETMSGFFSKMQTGEISTLDQVQKDTLFWKMQPEYRERVVKAFDTDAKKSRPEVLAILNQNAYTENERDRDMFANTDLAKRQIALPYIDSNGERSIKTMVLTDSEFKEAIQLQNEIKKAKQSEQERINMDGKRSVHSIAEDKAKLLKLNPEQKDFFHKRLLENVLVEETKGKKRLNAVQIEELASQLVTKVYEKSWLPDSSLRVFEIPRTKPLSENQYVPIKNIPENKIMEIKALFKKSQGKEPTDPQIELEYAKELFNRQQELNPANRTDIPFLK
jgi:hypothetical protein